MNTPGQADAIQTDVPSDVENEMPAFKSAREIAMDQIDAANTSKLEAELGLPLSSPTPEIPDDQIKQQLEAPAPVAPAPQLVKVKVDGVEKEVPVEDLVRTYQKNSAADRRLEEATTLLREAQERAAQPVTAPVQELKPVDPPADLQAEVKETLDKIYEGDPIAAAEALTNLLAKTRGGSQPTPAPAPVELDIDALTSRVQEQLKVDQAFETLKTDYPDLIADPTLETLTALKIQQAIASGTPRDKAMLSAAEDVYKSLGKTPAGRQPEAPKPNVRLENKQRLDPVPTASSAAVLPQVDAEETNPSSVIAQMAAKRLGQSLPQRNTG